ncbi:GspH/FimT family pseudopilin [Pseudoteredinibacter isoporae]|uniref:GspH/FimT family pseudopilin n=1 Tax=Pseudoteredinibacter isoporae TaxID=570281 RepID=UPI00310A4686
MTRRHVIEGFSLIELMVVLAIMAAAAGAALPAMGRMYDAMQYRDTVRSILSSTKAARFKALSTGRSVDWVYNANAREISVNDKLQQTLDESFSVQITSARDLSGDDRRAVIRFYPDGSSSGGDVRIEHETGKGMQIKVDWLFGRISQHSLDEEFI